MTFGASSTRRAISAAAGPLLGTKRTSNSPDLPSVLTTCSQDRNRPAPRQITALRMSQSARARAGVSAQNAMHSTPPGRTTRQSSPSATSGRGTVSSAQAQVTISNLPSSKGKASRRPFTFRAGMSAQRANIASDGSRRVTHAGDMPSEIKVRTNAPVPLPASSKFVSGVAMARTLASSAAYASPPACISQRR